MHQQLEIYGNEEDDLCIMETRFGLSVVGPSTDHPNGFYECSAVRVTSIAEDVDIWKFLEAEIAGVRKDCTCQTRTDEEIKYQNIMQTNWSRTDSGRLKVKLPWKIDPTTLPYNYSQAVQRDQSLNKQLKKDTILENIFLENFENMINKEVL